MSADDHGARRLSAAIRNGDEAAFDTFYRDWFDVLFSWSAVFVNSDEHLALDIVQETMIRVIRSLPALDSHAALVAWLRAANRSAAIDLLRRRLASQLRDRAVSKHESSLSAPLNSPYNHTEQTRSLAAALATLSPDDQLLLRLRADSNTTFEQLSSSLGATPDSLYGRARRALARLRTILSEEASDV